MVALLFSRGTTACIDASKQASAIKHKIDVKSIFNQDVKINMSVQPRERGSTPLCLKH